MLISGGFYWWYHARPANSSTQLIDNSLAVLPFINLGDEDSNPACDGIMDNVPDYVKVTPMFTFLHKAPRFIGILRHCNLIGPW